MWEATPHPVLMGFLPVQAGMFPVPLRLTSFEGDEKHTVSSWNYDIKYNRKDKEKTIAAVERILMVEYRTIRNKNCSYKKLFNTVDKKT